MADDVGCHLPDHPAVAGADGATGDDQVDRAVAVENVGDIDVVGDHEEPGAARDGLRNFLGRRSQIDEER